jgi:hypothetical protein
MILDETRQGEKQQRSNYLRHVTNSVAPFRVAVPYWRGLSLMYLSVAFEWRSMVCLGGTGLRLDFGGDPLGSARSVAN